jgi:hypothetical protein
MIARKIMVVPCIVKSASYVAAPTTVEPGRASCIRIRSASTPPIKKKPNAVTP